MEAAAADLGKAVGKEVVVRLVDGHVERYLVRQLPQPVGSKYEEDGQI